MFRPEVREQSGLETIEGHGYLYGGLGSKIFGDLYKLDM